MPLGLAVALDGEADDDESCDAELRRETGEALALTGKDVGTPTLQFHPPTGFAVFVALPVRGDNRAMDYATALVEQNRLLADLLGDADWSTPVPTCPGWTLLQLLRHVGRGDRWAAQIIHDRVSADLDPRLVRDGKPPDDPEGALGWLAESPRCVIEAVSQVGSDALVSTFLGPRPAPWWLRRRLHERTVHRADAAIALNRPYRLSAELAADGISEWLERLSVEQSGGGARALGLGMALSLHATDSNLRAAGQWIIHGTEDGMRWEHAHAHAHADADADTVLTGRAVDLLLSLVRRRTPDDVDVDLSGDRRVWQNWLELTPL